jgi:putative thioredoxin
MAQNILDETAFQTEVLEASRETPVLVDFWAEWCGPCRMVGPVVESLEQSPDYHGRFRLVKINTDQSPEISARYGISSIPAFKLFIHEAVVAEFVGALPEHALRRFLDRHLPDPVAQELEAVAASDPLQAAREALARDAQGDAAHEILWRGAVRRLLEVPTGPEAIGAPPALEAIGEIEKFLQAIPEIGSPWSDPRTALLRFLQSADHASGNGVFAGDVKHLQQLLGGEQGAQAAFEHFLARVEATRGDDRLRARDTVLLCFHLLGNQGPLVNSCRRRLSSLLF